MGCIGSKQDDDPPVKSEAKSNTETSVRNVAYQNNRTSVEKKVESVAAPVVAKDSSLSKAGVKTKPLTFKEVMEDKEGRAYFMKFLQHERAEENLVFFEVWSYDHMFPQYAHLYLLVNCMLLRFYLCFRKLRL